jgi:hypothetical protein
MFATEQEMSKMFEKYLKTNFGNTYLKECQGLFGVPDFVFYAKENQDISIISFELKLKNWKRAVKQAFRYKSFSNITYVVLSAANVKAALSNIDIFEKYNIGLAKFGKENDFEILYKPLLDNPYSENLNLKLKENIGSSRRKFKNIDTLIDKEICCEQCL